MQPEPPGPVRTRIAPSPTGLPHVGTIRNALYSWLLARRAGGQFLFRLEDTDRGRFDPGSVEALHDAFDWLGLDYDEGPDRPGEFGPYVQSERLEIYRDHIERLIAGGRAYRCFCSRERLELIREARRSANIHPHGYDRHCRDLPDAEQAARAAAGDPFVVRFKIPLDGDTAFEDAVRGRIVTANRELDDHVLLKSDGYPTYQFASVVDDHLMRITHVVRSEEWIPSTPRHVLLYEAFGWRPPVFAHPGLILGRDPTSGKVSKLSKRHGAVAVGEYRDVGYLPDALLNFIALLGWAPGGDIELMSREEMTRSFSLEGLNPSPSVFDLDKLNWMNGVYLRRLSGAELTAAALPFLERAGMAPHDPEPAAREEITRYLLLEQERMKRLDEAPALTEFCFGRYPRYEESAVAKWLRREEAPAILAKVIELLAETPEWKVPNIESAVRKAIQLLGVKPGEVIHTTRVAATGKTVGPGLFDALAVLGKDRALDRLRHARGDLDAAAAA